MISKKGVKQDDKHTGEKNCGSAQTTESQTRRFSAYAEYKPSGCQQMGKRRIVPGHQYFASSDSPEKIPPVCFNGTDKKKDPKNMVLRIVIDCQDGDKVRVNLPIPLIQMIIELGLSVPELSGNDVLKNINFTQIIELVECGVTGNLLEIDDADGDIIRIFVE